VGVLASLSSVLVDLHGQHETQTLLHADAQRDILDAYADALPARANLEEAWQRRRELEESAEALAARRDEVRRRADYLRHVASEIEAARVVPGEDEALALESRRLGQAGALGEHARRIAEALDGGEDSATAAIARAEKALAQLERVDPGPSAWREALDAAFAGLGDVARDAAAYADALEENPGRLDQVEQRRELLSRLMQKYGVTLDKVLDTGREAAAELELLDTADVDLRALAAKREGAEREVAAAAAALTELRQAAAQRLSRGVTRLLPSLGLPGGSFSVDLTPVSPTSSFGAERIEYLVKLNPGHEPRPLARTASGGELSRLMLALKTVLASHDRVPTLVFDEVDQGIGGEVGARVGEALAGVADRRQVLVITHLPQIAARADRHLSVAKRSKGGMATSDVEVLHGEDRVVELARMLGDADAATARRHAQALLSPEPRAARSR
jgi:DNA repair protein RecN (Recombination protein N)